MKTKLFVAILFFYSVISCSTPTQENTSQQNQVADTVKQGPVTDVGEKENEEEDGTSPLSLNNGMKWKADDVTNENVKAIKKIESEFENKSGPVLHDYHNTATKIIEATNKLLADCKMSGPEHEALHKWLLPLIGDTKKLLGSQDSADAAKIFSEIKERLNIYNHYFD